MLDTVPSPLIGAGAEHYANWDRRLLDSVSGTAAAGYKPYFSITEGYRYRALVLNYAATTLALSSMTYTLKANGIPFQNNIPATARDAWNQNDGLPAAVANTGQLVIPLSEFRMKDNRWGDLTAINVGTPCQQGGGQAIKELRLEIQLDANPVDITTFELYGITSDVNVQQSVWLPCIDGWQENVGVGTNQVFQRRLTTAGDHTRRSVRRLWMNDTDAHITRLTIFENGDPFFDEPTALTNFVDQLNGTRTPQASWQTWDGGCWGDGNRVIESYAVAALKTQINTAAGVATPLQVYVESRGTLS